MLKKIFNNQWFVGISCSIIAAGLLTYGTKLIDNKKVNEILQFELNFKLWQLLLVLIIIGLIIYFTPKLFKKKATVLKFLDYKNDNFSGFEWVWNWKEIENGVYKISNVKMLCPKCKEGVFTVATAYSQKYDCVKCRHSLPIGFLNKPSYDQIEDEIVNEIGKQYPTEMNYIEHE